MDLLEQLKLKQNESQELHRKAVKAAEEYKAEQYSKLGIKEQMNVLELIESIFKLADQRYVKKDN